AMWKLQIEGLVGRRAHAQQAGIESDDLLQRSVDDIGNETQINGVVGRNFVRDERRIRYEVCQTILLWILRHDGDGENDGDVVLRLLRKIVAAVQFPEICVTGALYGSLHVARAPIV